MIGSTGGCHVPSHEGEGAGRAAWPEQAPCHSEGHDEQHVLDHVIAKQDVVVDADAAFRRDSDYGEPGKERRALREPDRSRSYRTRSP
jgi:hypothetical protein